jgi:hypothetical protein
LTWKFRYASLRVHGYERTNELADAIDSPGLLPFVALRDGRVTAYATTLAFFPAKATPH